MSTFALILALNCPATKMQNVSGEPWIAYDYKILEQTKKRCGELYKTSPCVYLFRKFARQQYSVICGEENK